MRINRTLAVLGVVFIVLLGITYWQGSFLSEQFRQEVISAATSTAANSRFDDLPRVFTSFNEADIAAVRLGHPPSGLSLTLNRNGQGNWETQEYDGAVEQDVITIISGTIVLLPYTRTLPIGEDTDLAQYGFVQDNPAGFTIEIVLIDSTSHGLFVGNRTPDTESYYTLVDERDEIYLLDAEPIEFLQFQLTNPPINLTSE